MVLAKEHREYKEFIKVLCLAKRIRPFDGPLSIHILWHKKDKRRSDIDNRWKCLFDSLTGFAWHDDSQLEEMRVRRMEDRESYIEVKIERTVYGRKKD